jgi:hypothetical protein
VVLTLGTLAGSVGESQPNQQFDKPPAGHHLAAAPAAAYLLVVASGLVLIWRRRRPVLVLAVSLGAALLYTCLGYFDGPVRRFMRASEGITPKAAADTATPATLLSGLLAAISA